MESKILFSNMVYCNFSNVGIFKSVDFRGTVFNNIEFGVRISECIFKGCRIDEPEEIFIIIENYIEKSLILNTKINHSISPNTNFDKCNFDRFGTSDVDEIKELMTKIEKDSELPVRKSEKHRETKNIKEEIQTA